MEAKKIAEGLKKARYLKGRPLTKDEMSECLKGMLAMEKLGIFDKPKWEANRKEVRYVKK